jgi:hypothetical protein
VTGHQEAWQRLSFRQRLRWLCVGHV